MPSRNLMVMQSGGCTAVINRSLAGIIRAARKILPESRIYGANHGMEGVLFYTKLKTVTSRWPNSIRSRAEFKMPTN